MLFQRQNPDRDYVLRGSSPVFSKHTRSPTKSSLTHTTKSLSHNLLFSPDNLIQTFRDDLRRSKNTARTSCRTDFSDNREDLMEWSRPHTARYIPRSEECWFLERDSATHYWDPRPRHTTASTFPKDNAYLLIYMKDYEKMRCFLDAIKGFCVAMTVHHSCQRVGEMPVPHLGEVYRLTDRINRTRCPGAEKSITVTTEQTNGDQLARQYFPITLGDANKVTDQLMSDAPPPKTPTFSPPATGLPARDETPWRQETQETKGALRPQWQSTTSRLEREFLLADQAPTISANSVYASSPYQSELARLRMARLRLEGEILKEAKRQDEIERTRGPQPKWYELKTPQFNYESHKNTELLRASQQWQDLYDYHQELTSRSDEFNQSINQRAFDSGYHKERYMS